MRPSRHSLPSSVDERTDLTGDPGSPRFARERQRQYNRKPARCHPIPAHLPRAVDTEEFALRPGFYDAVRHHSHLVRQEAGRSAFRRSVLPDRRWMSGVACVRNRFGANALKNELNSRTSAFILSYELALR